MKKEIKIGQTTFTQTDQSKYIYKDPIGLMAVIIPNDIASKVMAQNDLAIYFSWELTIVNQMNILSNIAREIVTKEIISRGVMRAEKFMGFLSFYTEGNYIYSYLPCVTKLTYYKNF